MVEDWSLPEDSSSFRTHSICSGTVGALEHEQANVRLGAEGVIQLAVLVLQANEAIDNSPAKTTEIFGR
jgi:hypothetical protein